MVARTWVHKREINVNRLPDWCIFSGIKMHWVIHCMLQIARCRPIECIRDVTIRQQRRPWKGPWKIDSASFQIIPRSSKVARLLKRREFMLELKRGGRARVQTQRVEFIALPFPSSKQIKIWAFHVVVVKGRLRNVQKSVMLVQSCYFAN